MGFLEKQSTIAGRYQGLHRTTARSCQWLPLVGVELKMIIVKHRKKKEKLFLFIQSVMVMVGNFFFLNK
jgi:hypothetical protein